VPDHSRPLQAQKSLSFAIDPFGGPQILLEGSGYFHRPQDPSTKQLPERHASTSFRGAAGFGALRSVCSALVRGLRNYGNPVSWLSVCPLLNTSRLGRGTAIRLPAVGKNVHANWGGSYRKQRLSISIIPLGFSAGLGSLSCAMALRGPPQTRTKRSILARNRILAVS